MAMVAMVTPATRDEIKRTQVSDKNTVSIQRLPTQTTSFRGLYVTSRFVSIWLHLHKIQILAH